MHRYLTLPVILLFWSSGLLGATADAAVVSLKAVKINDVPIEPTNNVTVAPGDIIETEVWLWGWEDQNRCARGSEYEGEPCITDADCGGDACDLFLVRVYQAHIDGETGFMSGESGALLPVGWPAEPTLGGYIDEADPDFIFYGVPSAVIAAADTSTLDYRFGGLIFESVGVASVPGAAYYGGTLLLTPTTVDDEEGEACGTFTIPFSFREVAGVERQTFLVGINDRILVPTPEALVVNVVCEPQGACCTLSSCHDTTEQECLHMHGTWHEGASCNDGAFHCPVVSGFKFSRETRD